MPGIVWSATAAEVKQSCRRNTAHMLELTFPFGTVLQRYYDEYAAAANNKGNSTLETESELEYLDATDALPRQDSGHPRRFAL